MGDNGETFREGHQDRANFSMAADVLHALPWSAKWQQESLWWSSDTQSLGWNSGSADWNGASVIAHTHAHTHTHRGSPLPQHILTISTTLPSAPKNLILHGFLISSQLKKNKETTSIRKGLVQEEALCALPSRVFHPVSRMKFPFLPWIQIVFHFVWEKNWRKRQ